MEIIPQETKLCSRCSVAKPIGAFRKERANGRKGWCKECVNGYYRAYWKERNGEGRKRVRTHEHHVRKSLRRKYGLSLEEYNRMFAEQRGVCRVCGGVESGNPYGVLEVEHHHGTKKVRGLVCHPCNNAIMWYEQAREYPYYDRIVKYVECDGAILSSPATRQPHVRSATHSSSE